MDVGILPGLPGVLRGGLRQPPRAQECSIPRAERGSRALGGPGGLPSAGGPRAAGGVGPRPAWAVDARGSRARSEPASVQVRGLIPVCRGSGSGWCCAGGGVGAEADGGWAVMGQRRVPSSRPAGELPVTPATPFHLPGPRFLLGKSKTSLLILSAGEQAAGKGWEPLGEEVGRGGVLPGLFIQAGQRPKSPHRHPSRHVAPLFPYP